MQVRHRCPGGPNRLCCNPAHMTTGTNLENALDRFDDGTEPVGEKNPHAKLSEVDVLSIRRAHREGESYASLALRYQVHKVTIGCIVRGKSWSHIPLDQELPA